MRTWIAFWVLSSLLGDGIYAIGFHLWWACGAWPVTLLVILALGHKWLKDMGV